jgi:diketogulonate reductase-like aldo/keto reductase
MIVPDYYNEQCVGAAIRESGLAREDLWITSKFKEGDTLEEVHTSLRKVRLA